MLIDSIKPDPRNVRRVESDLSPLVASIKELGVLQPIVTRPGPDGAPMIVCGERRWRAAKLAGLVEIPAESREMTDSEARVAQLAENIQRAGMSMADEWQAVNELQAEHGYTLQQAGAALGLPHKAVRRMTYLGRMHPAVLDAIRQFGPPESRQMSVIAGAPLPVQASAIKAHTVTVGKGKKRTAEINWFGVRNACFVTRIPRGHAIFDTEAAPIVFEEDLFVEPGQEAFFTSDVAGFVAAQEAALAGLVEQRKTDGWAISLGAQAPRGYREFAPMMGDGTPQKTPAHEGDDRVIIAHVQVDGHSPGKVVYAYCKPTRANKVKVESHDRSPPAPRQAIDKRGQAAVAAAKEEGVRAALSNGDMPLNRLLHLLLLAMAGSNVRVSTRSGIPSFADVAGRLVAPDGTLAAPADHDLAALAVSVLQRVIAIAPTGTQEPDSGPVADWIGRSVHADFHTARFDTPEFLACASGELLRELAAAAGVKVKSVGALREALVGKLPQWRPVSFCAPGPDASAASVPLVTPLPDGGGQQEEKTDEAAIDPQDENAPGEGS